MALHPYNDNILVEIQTDKYGLAGSADEQKGVETGIVAELPESMWYLGMHSFAFEKSFVDMENIVKVHKSFRELIGKRVYWTQYTERGSILKQGDKTYALLKFTDIIAFEDDKKAAPAKSVNTTQGGGVSLN